MATLNTSQKINLLVTVYFSSMNIHIVFTSTKWLIFRLFNHNHSFVDRKYKTAHFQNFIKKLKTANESYPDFIITTVNCIFQCSYNAHSIHFKTGKSATALPIRKFYVDPSAIVVWLACLSKFVCMDDIFLLLVCQWAQIYLTLYKPKSTPKSWFKSWN